MPTSEIESAEPTTSPEPTAHVRARDRWEVTADWSWGIVRRIHLGTQKPGNWVQLFHFAVVGGSGYVINLIVFTLLAQGADINHLLAAIGAFAVAVTNNFLLNRHWTFRPQAAAESPAGFQAARFFAVSLVGLGVNLVVLSLLVEGAGLSELPSQAIAVALATPVNFIGNKLWTFDR
ncbi:MAG: GtrA family protein [Actinomycetota bacterium]|nr:GtrA family protein [Actinomycetota bacterium]